MSQDSALPNYTELSTILHKIQPNCHVSQIHGLLSGYICATAGEVMDLWQSIFPGLKKNHKGNEILKALYESTYHQLSEFSFEFEIILPDDENDINIRAESLGLWCQGFLTGLEQTNISQRIESDAELKEAFNDLVEIAQLTFGDIKNNEEDESAYFELVEYVRLSALMIFHELKNNIDAADMNNDEDIMH